MFEDMIDPNTLHYLEGYIEALFLLFSIQTRIFYRSTCYAHSRL